MMIPRQLFQVIIPLKRTIIQNRIITVIVCTLLLYYFTILSNEPRIYDLSDGKSSKGYGIIRGGTGNQCYDKDRRIGGLPKVTRFDDPSIYPEFDEDDQKDDFRSFDKTVNKIVIILGANSEGGVSKWKGPSEWSVERLSILNKKLYAAQHGYDLVVKDLTKLKKYSNEFREGWQKFDLIKEVMDEYNQGDWFWYLDLHTLIMNSELSLEDIIMDKLISRTIDSYNPKELSTDIPLVNYNEPLNLILTQDCTGFNLDSFLIRKSQWSTILLDILFDPVVYSITHPKWTNGESDALEYHFDRFPWVRSRIGFVPLGLLNSLTPESSCTEYAFDSAFFYNETSNDFMVNLVGCDQGSRNCLKEMTEFDKIREELKKSWYQRIF